MAKQTKQKELSPAQKALRKKTLAAGGGVLRVAGFIISFFANLCAFLSGFGLLGSEKLPDHKLYGVLMILAGFVLLAALVIQLTGKARLFSAILASIGGLATLFIGGAISDATHGYVNAQGFAFTELKSFWFGHMLPFFIALFCVGMWIWGVYRQKQEDMDYFLGRTEDKSAKADALPDLEAVTDVQNEEL